MNLCRTLLVAITVALVGAPLPEAFAATDVTGEWLDTYTARNSYVEDWVQTGTTLTFNGHVEGMSGTIDPDTGVFHLAGSFPIAGFCFPPPYSDYCFSCPIDTMDGTVAPDGKTLSGVLHANGVSPFHCYSYDVAFIGRPSPCSAGVLECCGDGMLNVPGEQCDDGNQFSGDSCPADCSYTASRSLIRGHRNNPVRDRTACEVEWYVVNPNNPVDRYGLPNRKQSCEDGDPSCDISGFDGDGNPVADLTPGWCRFQVVACLNNQDPNVAACTPNGVSSVTVTSPNPNGARIPIVQSTLAVDRATLETALDHLYDPLSSSDRYDRAIPLTAAQQSFCSAPFEIDVVVGGDRKRSVRLSTRSFDGSSTPRSQTSSLVLTCKSRPLP
jgi:cysteine-rich repeat protein